MSARPPTARKRRDLGRAVAVALCVVFAIVGAVPLLVGMLVRTDLVRDWAANKTSQLIARELGVDARYGVEVEAWPMRIALTDVTVDASDAGPPFLRVERITARPRPFSLLAGELDVGEVEIDRPWIRAVLRDGQLANLDVHLPQDDGAPSRALPFSSLAITEARVDLSIDTTQVLTEELDADVAAEEGGALEIAVHAGGASIHRTHPFPARDDEDSVDEDRICQLEARARIEDDEILVRRLSIRGSADFDPDPGTIPACALAADDWRAFDVALSAFRVAGIRSPTPRIAGRVHAKVPLAIAHRFADTPPLTGSATLDADVELDTAHLDRLPIVNGRLSADMPGADGKVFAETLHAQINVTESAAQLTKVDAIWGSGKVAIGEVSVKPFDTEHGRPLTASGIHITDVVFPDLLRDLGVHPQAHVGWILRDASVPEFKGSLQPLELSGPMAVRTEDFQVFDRSARRADRKRMIGLPEANVKGTFQIRPEGVVFQGFTVDSPRTHLATTVAISFKNTIALDVGEGSSVDLAEIGPLGDIPVGGVARISATMRGPIDHPKLLGDLSVQDFLFGGLPVGQIESAKVEFEPLELTLTDVRIRKGSSLIRSPRARFAFDEGPTVIVDADADTREAPHLEVHDLLEIFQIDKLLVDGHPVPDPRWADIKGRAAGTAHVRFVLGGPEDRCGGGLLRVDGDLRLLKMDVYGERYDDGDLDFGLVWDDRKAGANGMKLDVRSAIVRKGAGTITATAMIRHGGVLRAQAVASNVPIGSLDVLGGWGEKLDGSINAVARIGGRLDAITGLVDVEVSRVRVGPASLGTSRLAVELVPKGSAPAAASGAAGAPDVDPESGEMTSGSAASEDAELRRAIERTCNNPQGSPYEYGTFLADTSNGDFVVNGSMFGDQLTLSDVRISQQKRKVVRGSAVAKDLDLGVLANLIPGIAFSEEPPEGRLSARLDMKKVPLLDLPRSEAQLSVSKLTLGRGGQTARLLGQNGVITLANDTLVVPGLRIEGRTASGLTGVALAGGKVEHALSKPSLDVSLKVEPLSLQRLSADIPGVERANGVVEAQLSVKGPPDALQTSGALRLKNGELYVKGLPVGLTDTQVEIEVGAGDVRIRRATARVGSGSISVTGGVPIHGTDFGTAVARIKARGVKMPVADGVTLTADADLEATLRPEGEDGQRPLPDVTGTVELTSFAYTRPIELAVNLAQLGARQRTAVETYDPKNDSLRFNLTVVSPKPLSFANNLVDMKLEVVEPGLVLSGTNQRFGAKGMLRIRPESKLRLRNTEFEVREGSVRFDDPHRISPKVDMRATTEYRRNSSGTSSGLASATPSAAAGAQSTQAGGAWRISMHAYGNADALKVDLSSDPALRQEDIVLLLTFGLTRAELDQGLASSVGETVGLEALSALTGADKAVKTIVPVIDEFRFGTSYSSRTNRPQAMVTVGKRLTDSVRATVTTGVTENRDVRGTIEWQLDKGVRIQGSYDNFNDTYGLPFGNLGADLRWRLEFE